MSITSPLSILFWLGIYGSILPKVAATIGTSQLLLYSCMMFLGLMIWDLCVAGMTIRLKRSLKEKNLTIISILSGITLIGFGLYFGFQGIRALLGEPHL